MIHLNNVIVLQGFTKLSRIMIQLNYKSMARIVFTVKPVISRIQSRISTGFLLREEVVPYTQKCKGYKLITNLTS
jgi:hypothetical protein